jgi:hypothetical protein
MAQTANADRVTLLALWDRRAEGDAPGGTAHAVECARQAGTVEVGIIDAAELPGAGAPKRDNQVS